MKYSCGNCCFLVASLVFLAVGVFFGCKKNVDEKYVIMHTGNLIAGDTVTFYSNAPLSNLYFWDFGDNTVSSLASSTHIYYKPGMYTVTLKLNNNNAEIV